MTHEEIELLADKMFYSHCAVYGKSPQEEAQHLEMWHHAFRAALDYEREECAKVCENMRPSKREHDSRFFDGCTESAAAIRAREP